MLIQRSFFLLGAIFASGCNPPQEATSIKTPPGSNDAPMIYVFATKDNGAGRLVFAFRDGELFVCDFPAKAKEASLHKRYMLKTLPADFNSILLTWTRKYQTAHTAMGSGEIKSNGPATLTRHEVHNDPQKTHSWSDFIDDNEVRGLIETVRATALKPGNEVESLPTWIEEDSRLRADFVPQDR